MITNAFPATTPCDYTFLYPPIITQDTIQQDKPAVTFVHNPCTGKAYLAISNKDRLGFSYPISGDLMSMAQKYDEIPWEEIELTTQNGLFSYKKAPSHRALIEYFSDSAT
ncbi:hypothetical protein IHP72_15430 [Bacillus pumilus]|uniref:hypothetical protein n=1 Tax=Bacillus pumilus TaxID=1408 RepID=UPI001B3A4AFB|nr:hypothetical protein [Bacillus pumilus]MBQ4817645.1 hypothetical protein [Bacillus pumilus]